MRRYKPGDILIRTANSCGRLTVGAMVKVRGWVSYNGQPAQHLKVTVLTGPYKGDKIGSTGMSFYRYATKQEIETMTVQLSDKQRITALEERVAVLENPPKAAPISPLAELKAAHAVGKIIQYKDFMGIWVDLVNPVWNPHEEYRIKPAAPVPIDQYAKLKAALAAGKIIEVKDGDGWVQLESNKIHWICHPSSYRIKPDPEYMLFNEHQRGSYIVKVHDYDKEFGRVIQSKHPSVHYSVKAVSGWNWRCCQRNRTGSWTPCTADGTPT